MATKLLVLATVLTTLVALASASAGVHTTVVTKVEENKNSHKSCRTELWHFSPYNCITYLQESRSTFKPPFLRSAVANSNPPYLCCDDLVQLSYPCRCEAMKSMLDHIKRVYSMAADALVYKQMLESLPRKCYFESSEQCQL